MVHTYGLSLKRAVRRKQSSASHDERRGEVAVNDEGGEGVVLANFVLLCVDLLSQHFVKVDLRLLTLRRLGAHLLHIKVVL